MISDADLKALFRVIDKDHNGVVDMDEFFAFVADMDESKEVKVSETKTMNRSVALSDPDTVLSDPDTDVEGQNSEMEKEEIGQMRL